jgi:molecular chaperone GrpE
MSEASGPAQTGGDDQEVPGMSDLGFGPGPDWGATDAGAGDDGIGAQRDEAGSKQDGDEPAAREAPSAAGDTGFQEALVDEGMVGEGSRSAEAGADHGEDRPGGEGVEPPDERSLLIRERDEYLRMLQQVQADFENYRKRVLRQASDAAERAAQGLLERLLPVLDTVELARAHAVDSAVEQVAAALFELLEKEGLERVRPAPGAPFDPVDQEAVAHEPGDGEPEVVEVLRDGYRYRGRVLRAALVKVKG